MTEPSCVEGVERAYQEERGNAKRTRHVEKPKLGDGQGECGGSQQGELEVIYIAQENSLRRVMNYITTQQRRAACGDNFSCFE